MKKKKMIYLLVSSLAITLTASLSSCVNSETKKWAYTKDEMSDFIEMEAIQTNNSDNTITFSADTNVEIFDENIDKDDVIVFNKDKVKEELEKSNKEYADYSILKKASVDVVNVHSLDTKDGFDITFKTEDNSANYGMLLYSKVTTIDKFTSVNKYEENKSIQSDPQAEYEEKYVSQKRATWETGGKIFTSIISGFVISGLGLKTGNPIAISNGLLGIFSTLMETTSDKGTSIKDVMTKLKDIDKKIDDISNKIDRNTQILQDEIVRTNANVDQANLNILNIAINDFATNAIAPINNFNRNLEDEVGNYYKKFISEPQTIKLVLEKNSDDEYTSIPLVEINDIGKYNFQIEISDFTNAKAFLAQNNNIVKDGFVGELQKDIENALNKSSNLSKDITIENYNTFIRSRILENFSKEYFSTHNEKAQEYRNLMIEYAERICGMNGKVNYLNTYLSRLQYMYNFQAEIKPLLRTFCSNLLKILETNGALAIQACTFAEYNYDELSKVFISARDGIQNFYETNKNKDDSYSFVTTSTLTGDLYISKYNVSYTNAGGNHPDLHVKFETYTIGKGENCVISYDSNISNHKGIAEASHLKISTRWNLLKSIGEASSDKDYVHYLTSNNVIASSGTDAADFLRSLRIIDSSCYRILTNDRSERDLNSNDSISLTCIAKGGKESSYYFSVGDKYTYRANREADCWSGKTFEGKFINASSGTSFGTQKICSWARYAEDHWYWSTDEFFAFSADSPNNYYFIVEESK